MEEHLNSDTAKEVLTVLSYYNEELLNNLPDEIIKELTSLAADSDKDYFIKKDKKLIEQNLSEDCKDLLAILFYNYQTDDKEKEELLNKWIENEKE